jgi:hypothetical protein
MKPLQALQPDVALASQNGRRLRTYAVGMIVAIVAYSGGIKPENAMQKLAYNLSLVT